MFVKLWFQPPFAGHFHLFRWKTCQNSRAEVSFQDSPVIHIYVHQYINLIGMRLQLEIWDPNMIVLYSSRICITNLISMPMSLINKACILVPKLRKEKHMNLEFRYSLTCVIEWQWLSIFLQLGTLAVLNLEICPPWTKSHSTSHMSFRSLLSSVTSHNLRLWNWWKLSN